MGACCSTSHPKDHVPETVIACKARVLPSLCLSSAVFERLHRAVAKLQEIARLQSARGSRRRSLSSWRLDFQQRFRGSFVLDSVTGQQRARDERQTIGLGLTGQESPTGHCRLQQEHACRKSWTTDAVDREVWWVIPMLERAQRGPCFQRVLCKSQWEIMLRSSIVSQAPISSWRLRSFAYLGPWTAAMCQDGVFVTLDVASRRCVLLDSQALCFCAGGCQFATLA